MPEIGLEELRAVEISPLPVRRGRRGQTNQRLSEVLHLYFIQKLSMRKIANVLGVSHMSVYRTLSDPGIEVLI